ncbi:MAG: glutamine-hydrolyzing carbamoyl-phosphate synthase small subunit [Chitinophagaceae bacterium]|nr:glutamine-hydrolyzing carbamoyl-phosphate synthase small subunit [Chitinophagaceae bacterium]
MKSAILLLKDGTIIKGEAFGKIGTATGELCFNTGMTGYQEVFTDPSYFGQVLIMNTAHIGNYGTKNTDVESDSIKISALIAKNLSSTYSRQQADDNLENYLIKNNIVAIHHVDTRFLVSHVRENGAMNCIISSEIEDIEELKKRLDKVPSMEGLELSTHVTTKEPFTIGDEKGAKRIAVLDLGVKKNILNCMTERGAFLKVFPAKTSFEEMQEFNPSAYFLSNGPGDPAAMDYVQDSVSKMLNTNLPVFGICLGHQLLAINAGAKTYKMGYGHRGLNHPVLNLATQKSEISTQNHGFAVEEKSLESLSNVEVTHINLNDNTIEGIKLKDKPVFSVQYHPEATPGPHDSRYLFDQFINSIN